jgi:hypothetical protein
VQEAAPAYHTVQSGGNSFIQLQQGDTQYHHTLH